MASPLTVTNDDIKALTDKQLVQLLWQLLYLELLSHNIELFDSHVPLSIYIKDGGIDGLAAWKDGPAKTNLLPGRDVGFQAKATDMSSADCRAEVQTKDGRLKPQVRKLLERGGTYVMFLGRDCVEESKGPRIEALKDGITTAGLADGEAAIAAPDVRILDASDIAAWVGLYPAAVSTVCYFRNRASVGMGWSEMSGYSSLQIPYVESDKLRVEAIESIQDASRTPRSIIRVIGSAGLGKTRLVYEAFRPPLDPVAQPSKAALSSLYCYLSASSIDKIEQVVIDWRRQNRFGVIVVDDCPFELHETLRLEVTRGDSRLALITIGNDRDTSAYAGTDSKLVVVQPTTDEAISALLAAEFADLREEDRKFISAELAQGYPQMAILVAQARRGNAHLSARLTPNVLSRMLGRSVEKGSAADKVISVCSLFEYVGITGDVANEREFVRQVFCPDVSADDFYANVVEFEKTGALSRYGRLVQVRPRPLAIRLAADWWERCTPEIATHVVGSAFPDGLAKAFCERLRMLDFVPALQETTARLCGAQGPFGQAKVLNSELGSRLFRAIAEVNPLAAASALHLTLGALDELELRKIAGNTRRNLIWALEKLCFRADTFGNAADLLSRLAAAENEKWSNNATGVFNRLFMVLLSGTQAPLWQRLPILRAAAVSESPRMRSVAVAALQNALRTHQFLGRSGPEYQSGKGPLPEYRPKLWKEVFDYWSSCLEELVGLAISDPANAEAAAAAISGAIRGLLMQGRLDDVESAVKKVAAARDGVWPSALDGIKDSLKYEGNSFPDEARRRIESWLIDLEPKELSGKIALHVTAAPFEHDEDANGNWRNIAAERAETLGESLGGQWSEIKEILPMVMRGAQNQGFAFGRGLARGMKFSGEALEDVMSALEAIPFEERNSVVLSGWLSAADDVAPEKVDHEFGRIAVRQGLRRSLPSICRGLRLSDTRVGHLVSLLEFGAISCRQLHGLSYGQAMAAVSVEVVADLCDALGSKGIEGAWVALDIGFMFLYGNEADWPRLALSMRSIVATKGMLQEVVPEWRLDSDAFAKVAEKLVPNDPDLAAILTQEIIDATAELNHLHEIDHCISEVLGVALETQIDTAWPLLAGALADADGSARWGIGHVLSRRFGDAGEKGLLGKVPMKHLAQWCKQLPGVAPKVLASIVQVMDLVEGQVALSEEAAFLINEYGSDPDVLSELAANFHSFSWSGSLVPYYERQVVVMEPLTRHPRHEVQQWSRRLIDSAEHQIKREKERDQEQEIGRY